VIQLTRPNPGFPQSGAFYDVGEPDAGGERAVVLEPVSIRENARAG